MTGNLYDRNNPTSVGPKTIMVSFAWSDAAPIPVPIGDNQTVREAVLPYAPAGNTNIGVIDLEGVDVTGRRGSQMNQSARVIVNTTGFVPGGR